MANFLLKFVKSKSRSKSPVKHQYYRNQFSNYPTGYSDESLINDNKNNYHTLQPNYSHNSLNYNKMTPFNDSTYLSPQKTERHLYDYNKLNKNEYNYYKEKNNESYKNCSPNLLFHPHQSNKYLNLKKNKNSKKLIKQQNLIENCQNYTTNEPFSQAYLDHNNMNYDDIYTEQYNQVKK